MGGRFRLVALLACMLCSCAGKSTTLDGEAGAGGTAGSSGAAGAAECPYPPSDEDTACTTWEDCTWVIVPACCGQVRVVGYALGHECAPSPITCAGDCALEPGYLLDIGATVTSTDRIFAMCDALTNRCISYTEAPPVP